MEEIIRAKHVLDTFVADYDALQATADALATDTTVLNDDTDTTPRADAPQLTGADLQNLRDFSANMSAVIGAAAEQVLIGKMVRPLATVLKIG